MLIKGGEHKDHRGTIRFVNDFDMSDVKRMYSIIQNIDTIRAWQGHKKERKWFHVVRGKYEITLVNISEWEENKENVTKTRYELSEKKNEVLSIPPGYYNGFRALEEDSLLVVYSDASLEESSADDFRLSIETLPWGNV